MLGSSNLIVCVFAFTVGDGRLGYPEEAPYDAIHVGAAAPSVPQAVSSTTNLMCTSKCLYTLTLYTRFGH